ncbi:MAG: hypothetical protein JW801_10920 [Bacteroidales bacterium]|nr:hypothetical protein [Bacteroidales bacterium]
MNKYYLRFIISYRQRLNQLGIRHRKVFVIGFNKTGTSSLHFLFRSLGLPSMHGIKREDRDNIRILRKYDCFCDYIPIDLRKIDQLFPNAKYILQVRDLDTWVYSRLAHIERAKRSGTFQYRRREWDNTEYAITSVSALLLCNPLPEERTGSLWVTV